MLYLIFLFGISTAVSFFISSVMGVGNLDVLILALIMSAVYTLLLFHVNAQSHRLQSIVFIKYNSVLQILTLLILCVICHGAYRYFSAYGFWKTSGVMLAVSVLMVPFHKLIKLKLGIELLLYPILAVGLTLFYYYVV